jgi:cobalt-zinc-cadmium efflux system outer membrane protein
MSLKLFGLALAMTMPVAHAQAQTDPCGIAAEAREVVSLSRAIQLAGETDLRPELAAAGIRTARTERAIAALRPAYTVSLGIEDFPGTGLASNIDSLQVSGSFSRVWERGGKREAREALASSGVGLAQTQLAQVQFDIREEVETLYVEAALVKRRIALACERVVIARDLEAAIQKRIDAARDPLLAGARASSDRLQAEADARRYSVQAGNLRAALGTYWMASDDFEIDPDFIDAQLTAPVVVMANLYTPDLDRLDAERLQSSARIELERSQAIPDVTWSVGLRKFGIEDDLAVIGGASIPLGSAGRSETAVARARANQRRIEVESDLVRQQLLRQAVGFQRAAISARDEIERIDTLLLPAANKSVDLARDGYARGAFSYLDIIAAQRDFAALREERLAHLRTYILNKVALARLTPSVAVPAMPMETPK